MLHINYQLNAGDHHIFALVFSHLEPGKVQIKLAAIGLRVTRFGPLLGLVYGPIRALFFLF